MGTSTNYNAPPNWNGNKATLTRHSGQRIGQNGIASFVGNHIDSNGGKERMVSGRGILGSGATAKMTATRIGSFFSDVLQHGFVDALRRNDLQHLIGKPIKDIFRAIQELWDIPGNSIDETDSRAALIDLFEEIENDAETANIDEVLQQKTTAQLLIRYFGYYIFEQIQRIHYEDEIKNQIGDNPERHFNEIKDFIQLKIQSIVFDEDIATIDWFGNSGRAIIDRVSKSVFEVF